MNHTAAAKCGQHLEHNGIRLGGGTLHRGAGGGLMHGARYNTRQDDWKDAGMVPPERLDRGDGVSLAFRRQVGRGPVVVFLPGLRSDMLGSKACAVAEFCAARGQAFLRLDYSGHGESDGRFEEGTIGRWFEDALEKHQAPLVSGRRLKLRYITQAKARPPTFIIFGTRAEQTPEDYRRYLVNQLRTEFELPGTPVRLQFRGSENPFDKES
jgi:hypothetical protein